jgi:soluble lytic murein transglycosylase-like protein
MTWSNTTGFDLPIEKFSDSANFEKKVSMRAAKGGALETPPPAETSAQAEASAQQDGAPALETPSADETPAVVANVPSESAIELRPSIDARTIPPSIDPQKIPLPPIAKPVVHRAGDEICETVSKSAQSNALPIAYLVRLLFQESGFDSASVSRAGAQGIAQFMPETAASEGLKNPFDPLQAIPASARLLRKLFDQFGNLGLAAAAYNAGPKRIQDWLAKKSKLPQETEGYVKIITGRPAETWRVASASGTALTVPNRAPCKNVVPPPLPPVATRTIIAVKTPVQKTPAHPHNKAKIQVAAAQLGKPAKLAKTAARHHKVPTEQLAAAARKHKAKPTRVAQQ